MTAIGSQNPRMIAMLISNIQTAVHRLEDEVRALRKENILRDSTIATNRIDLQAIARDTHTQIHRLKLDTTSAQKAMALQDASSDNDGGAIRSRMQRMELGEDSPSVTDAKRSADPLAVVSAVNRANSPGKIPESVEQALSRLPSDESERVKAALRRGVIANSDRVNKMSAEEQILEGKLLLATFDADADTKRILVDNMYTNPAGEQQQSIV